MSDTMSINDTDDSDDTDGYVIRSPYRPMTRGARKALKEYDVLREISGNDRMNRGNGVVVAELPPEDLLEKHELEIDRDPDVVFQVPSPSSTVEIYTDPDKVLDGGVDTSMDPVDAAEHALEHDWDVVEGDPDAVLNKSE